MGTRQTRGRRRYNPGHVKIVVQYYIAALLVVVLCIVVGKNIALNRADKPGPTDEPTVTAPVGGGDEQETPEPGGETESPAPEETPVSTPGPETSSTPGGRSLFIPAFAMAIVCVPQTSMRRARMGGRAFMRSIISAERIFHLSPLRYVLQGLLLRQALYGKTRVDDDVFAYFRLLYEVEPHPPAQALDLADGVQAVYFNYLQRYRQTHILPPKP